MGKILSQEEIDALLGSATTLESGSKGNAAAEAAITYNFRRPDRASREQIRSLHFLHDRFARNVSTSLSAYLRAVTEVGIVSVEQFTYSEFLMSLPDPTAFYALSLNPMEGIGALELNPVVAFTMIDRMLGGSGQRVSAARALTEIEQNVIDGVVKLILENLSETWAPIVPVNFRVTARETRPQMLQVAAPNEAMILLVFDIRIGGSRGMLNLCIPTSIIEAFGATFTQGYYRTRRQPTAEERQALFENLGRVPMPVTALLRTSLPARELLSLRPGDVVSLGVPIHRPLSIRVGDVDQFEGTPVRAGINAGIALTSVGEQALERVES
jgi:flagellar motor switch protein FliM